MQYSFFANSQKTWKSMFDAIYSAKKTIYLEMYIFQKDIAEFNFVKLLKEKAINGVKVKIILDSYGSSKLTRRDIDELRLSGIELLFISYFFHRTHRKILIVDEETAFIGGVNFYKDSSLWNDLMVKVKGKIVKSIIRSFSKVYVECGGKDVDLVKYRAQKPKENKKVRDWLVEHFPTRQKFGIKSIYRDHISSAKNHIILVTPYFMPKRWLMSLLHQAVLRGVNVEVLAPRNTDAYYTDRVNYYYMHKLSALGVKFFTEDEMNHAKIMIIDNKEAIVGSQNLDFLSFDLNYEVGIFFQNLEAIGRINRIINVWKTRSKIFNPSDYRRHWLDYILIPIINLPIYTSEQE